MLTHLDSEQKAMSKLFQVCQGDFGNEVGSFLKGLKQGKMAYSENLP
jgi:hypothetical protein